MKELTKKILEAGLVDKTMAQLLERWHLLTPAEAALATKPIAVTEALEQFIENLEELLDREPLDSTTDKPMRETRLEIVVREEVNLYYKNETIVDGFLVIQGYKDGFGRLIFRAEYDIHPGTVLYCNVSGGLRYLVKVVEDLYSGSKLIARQATVDEY